MKDHISISSSLRSSVSSDDLSREPEKQVGFSPTLKVPKVPMKREDNKAKLIQDRRKSKAFFIPDDSHDTFIFSDNTIAVHDIKNLNVNKDQHDSVQNMENEKILSSMASVQLQSEQPKKIPQIPQYDVGHILAQNVPSNVTFKSDQKDDGVQGQPKNTPNPGKRSNPTKHKNIDQ